MMDIQQTSCVPLKKVSLHVLQSHPLPSVSDNTPGLISCAGVTGEVETHAQNAVQ